jgi:hypothetical protein
MPDIYDDLYPGDVAGHVEAGSFITDDVVSTTEGLDEFFTGADVHRTNKHNMENVGGQAVNRLIAETVKDASQRSKPREAVSVTGVDWRTGNVTLQDGKPIRLLQANWNRKDVVVTNQSGAVMYVSNESSGLIGSNVPTNVAYLPPGSGRTFEHRAAIWVVGVAGQTVDFVETNYVQ